MYHCTTTLFYLLNYKQIYLFGQIQTSQVWCKPYNDTSTYEVSEYNLE